ncbi:MAG: Tox-REase-5 domain-containing protein [Telluria sp.]|nr:Tox-REase-5 domain-containing protein [Telluria sp.]
MATSTHSLMIIEGNYLFNVFKGCCTSAGGSTASNALRQGGLRNLTQLVGKSEGGPGAWQLSPMRSKGEAYQEQITGAQRGIEYDVALIGAKGEKVRFDGYDASRKVLLDAKDWKGFPPKDTVFWTENVLKEAKSQLEAAKGVPIEWHFSTQSGRDAVLGLFRDRDITGITLVVTSGH